MKFFSTLPYVLTYALSASALYLGKKSTGSSNDLNLPSGGMAGYNGIAWGWLPDDDYSFTSMSTINGWTGKKASTHVRPIWYGTYAQIDDKGSFVNQLTSVKKDVVASGAVWIPAVMPTISGGFSAVTDAHCQKVASIIQDYVNSGVEVWLRFGHEMNYYVTDGTYHGSSSDFVAMWRRMHNALSNIDGKGRIMMFWSPNQYCGGCSPSVLDPWYPGDNYVDIVGIDWYPSNGYTTFANVYGPFYNYYAKGHNKHFAIGETGIGGSSDVGHKEAWVKALSNADVSAYPFYKSATWFEYNKQGTDFRVIMGQTSATIKQTLSNFK